MDVTLAAHRDGVAKVPCYLGDDALDKALLAGAVADIKRIAAFTVPAPVRKSFAVISLPLISRR